MKELLLALYQFLAPFVLFLPLLHRRDRRSRRWLLLFAVYLVLVINITGMVTLYDVLYYGLQWRDVNLIPFSNEIKSMSDVLINAVQYGLNVTLFIPLGFILPSLCEKFRSVGWTVLAGAAFSLLIELSQLFNSQHAI